ncbi:DUF4352 domain-containing protein [Actinomadura sp. 9N407]|uniref:DUF4352 domain-containing protein n=1 Tax=Actinomadura sp. 9N407 TaxID=3375154 RepID=UPI0037884AE2
MRTILTGLGLIGALTLTGCAMETEPTEIQKAGEQEAEPGKATPIKLTAKKTAFSPGILNNGGDFSCAKVALTNKTAKNLAVNPLDFSLTGTDGVKHDSFSGFGEHDEELGAVTLAPEEKATGAVCAEGDFTPDIVTFAPAFADGARAEVS